MEYAQSRNQILRILTMASGLLFVVANIMNFTYPGPDENLKEAVRIFYIHLGTFFGAFVVFFVGAYAGFQFLRTADVKWDHLGLAGVEVGLALSAVTMITGAIWAKPIWGTYWTWDPRLTTIAIMWLVYAAYLFLRASVEDLDKKRRFSAVYVMLAFLSVILTTVIVRIRPDAIHPVVAGPTSTSDSATGSFDVTARIAQTVGFNIVTYIIIAITLMWYRIRMENWSANIQIRKQQVHESL